jgi:hypothetical protein
MLLTGRSAPKAGAGSRHVLEEDLAESFQRIHELVDGGRGLLAADGDATARALLLARRVGALGQRFELAHEGLHRSRGRCGPALALLDQAAERGMLFAGGVHLLGPPAESGIALLLWKQIGVPRVEAIEELILEQLLGSVTVGC